MKTALIHTVAVVALVAAAEGIRRVSVIEARLATLEQQLAATGTITSSTDSGLDDLFGFAARVPFVSERLSQEVKLTRALAAYERGDYPLVMSGALAPAADDNTRLRLVAADAAYRSAVAPKQTASELARRLDDVLKTYADVLERDPSADAAYNFEFVSRLRRALASGRTNPAATPRTDIQGEQGEPPKGTRDDDFNVIVPLRPDEREDQLDAGAGAARKRKG